MKEDNFDNEKSEDLTESNQKIADIRERAFAFAVRIVKLCRYLEKSSNVAKSVINQLLDAGTSVGANLEEAQAGQTKPDFIHKKYYFTKRSKGIQLLAEACSCNLSF